MYRCVIAQLFSDLSKYCSAFVIRVKLVPQYVDTKMLRNSVKLYHPRTESNGARYLRLQDIKYLYV